MATFEIPKKIDLRIVTPERSLVTEAVDEVVLPGVEGYLGALPGHTPLLTSLKIGEIKYRSGGAWSYLAVSWGFAEILPDRVTILADVAERAEEIDVERAKSARERAEKKLKQPDADFLQAEVALQHAMVRLQVAARAAPLPR
jgi:F-type H+-transporting ATPase subunit epsilon